MEKVLVATISRSDMPFDVEWEQETLGVYTSEVALVRHLDEQYPKRDAEPIHCQGSGELLGWGWNADYNDEGFEYTIRFCVYFEEFEIKD